MSPRRNSQLAYPPAMEGKLLALLEEHQDTLYKKIVNIEEKRGRIKPYDRILLKTSLPLDLTGMGDHYPKQKMKASFRTVPVVIKAQSAGDPAGSWTHTPRSQQRITLYVPVNSTMIGLGGLDTPQLRGTLRHELRHMVQTMLTSALGGGYTGITEGIPAGAWDKATQRHQQAIQGIETRLGKLGRYSDQGEALQRELRALKAEYGPTYYLDPAEYYPHMGNAKDELMGGRTGPGEAGFGKEGPISRKRFDHVVRTYPLFSILKTYAPDIYRKAVGDLGGWMAAHNSAIKATKTGRPLTTSRILSTLVDRLDKENPALAAEIRHRRAYYEAYTRKAAT